MSNFTKGREFVQRVFIDIETPLEDYPVEVLIDFLKAADDLYHNDDESFFTDAQYDAVRQVAQRLEPDHEYFVSVGSDVRGGKIKLPFQMGSLNQVYVGEWDQWIRDNNLLNEVIVISDKEDGGSDMVRYQAGKLSIAYSRGDGEMGADLTRHVKNLPTAPKTINYTAPLTVRCEHIISPENFKKLQALGAKQRSGKPYKNPRNMVAGLMNSSEIDQRYYQYIDLVAYQIVDSKLSKQDQFALLKNLGFQVVPYHCMFGRELDEKTLTAHLVHRKKVSKWELDGVVCEVDSAKKRNTMHSGELNPGYAVKFKVADASNFAIATVRNVEWNISKDGYYKPRVQIKPVDLVGVTISNLTGFNAKFIRDNGIGPGAKIKITRSGDVIPFIMGTEVAVEPQMPDDPDAVWTSTGVDLKVADISNNDTVKYERLVDFFNSIDVPHLAEGNLKTLFDLGFDTPESIIVLSEADLAFALGSKAIAKKIHQGMRARFTNIPLYDLMGSHAAFGRGVGKRKMKKLYEAFEGDMSLCKWLSEICAVEGFDEKTANKIVAGYAEFQEFLLEVGNFVTVAQFEGKKTGKLSGMTFVFTGFRNADLEKSITDQGGVMGSAVSSKTTYLVTAEPNSTSGKAKKARDLGVKVIGVDELKKML